MESSIVVDVTVPMLPPSPSSFAMMLEQIRSLRLFLTPLLPPPVLSAMSLIDAYLQDVTEEASTLIFLSAILGWCSVQLVRVLSHSLKRSSSYDDDDDDVLGGVTGAHDGRVVGTVVLCGPSHAGKTVLFHALCSDRRLCEAADGEELEALLAGIPVATVTSVQAADRVLSSSRHRGGGDVRLLDYPGHPSLRSSFARSLAHVARIVLVLDATKPVAHAADFLYLLLTHPDLPWNGGGGGNAMRVLVACHKSDLALAKNPKRVKLQLRTELERLRKIQQSSSNVQNNTNNGGTAALPLGIPGKALDLDDPHLSCRLSFAAVSCCSDKKKRKKAAGDVDAATVGAGWKAVRDFVHDNDVSAG